MLIHGQFPGNPQRPSGASGLPVTNRSQMTTDGSTTLKDVPICSHGKFMQVAASCNVNAGHRTVALRQSMLVSQLVDLPFPTHPPPLLLHPLAGFAIVKEFVLSFHFLPWMKSFQPTTVKDESDFPPKRRYTHCVHTQITIMLQLPHSRGTSQYISKTIWTKV